MRVCRWLFRFTLAGVLAVLLGYMPYRTYGPSGIGRVLELDHNLHQILRKNAEISAENDAMLKQIRRLKTDKQELERVARDEFGLVRPNDLVFQFE